MNDHDPDDGFLEPERYELADDPFLLDRRELFAVLGGGLVIACLAGEAAAQRPGRRPGGGRGTPSRDLGAWLHIDEDGAVTVYTGKVEVGQNVRTELTQVVAEELRLPPARIALVMADTARTPFDAGTAGSRSTPVMAAHLRRAAAAAREALLDLAAGEGKVKRELLVVADGKVSGTGGAASFTFGQLTRGKKLARVIDDRVPVTPPDRWKVAGTSVPKVNGRAFVTGGHRYTSDLRRPGMLFGRVLRPPSFGAKRTALRTVKAEAMPGVVVVRSGDFVGVAAPTAEQAEEALAALEAEWTETPQPSSEQLFKQLRSTGRGRRATGSGRAGFDGADTVLEATYTIAYIAHAPLEPRAAMAEWSDGKLTVWTGTQMPFRVQGELAAALGVPADGVRVIVPDTGSGYGGKHTGDAAVEAARLAKVAGRPVKLVWTREEEFTWAYFRPAGVIEVKGGVRKDGTLLAWEVHNYNSGAAALATPYSVAHREAEFHPTDSPLRQGSYRALAATANHFARESHMDDLARAVGRDPLAFRLKNLRDDRLRAVLEAAARQFGWGTGKPEPGHGYGLAVGTEKGGYVASCVEVAVDRKAGTVRVTRVVSAFECGAILNPDHLRSQVEGCIVMALGGALHEQIRFKDGRILNPRFSDYRVPRFRDAPRIDTVLLDRKDLPSAGAGEAPMITVAPAIGNALFHATGVRLRSMPLVPNGFPKG